MDSAPGDDPPADEAVEPVDLDAVAVDLADVERAMERIEAGTYWTDEITGAPLSDELLAERPTARRAAAATPPWPATPVDTPPADASPSDAGP